MKCASIDVGTNTVLLLIAEVQEHVRDILDIATITRLGEGVRNSGYLSRTAMERTFSALKQYKELAEQYGIDKIHCVGTSALREAKNSRDFLKRVEEELRIPIRVITGREEAYYTYLSAKTEDFSKGNNLVIVDIGGGSTEIIKGDRKDLTDFVSLPLGSVKLTEMFIRHDPPSADEIENLIEYIRTLLSKVPFDAHDSMVIGTGGTITNCASIIIELSTFDKKRIHGLALSENEIRNTTERLQRMTTLERQEVAGMERGREDIILQGIILLSEIMSCFDMREMVVSANGVRYGVVLSFMDQTSVAKMQ